ncbi:hypothetical protein DEU56DRAFT_738781 [Suillus clintonianus]|uniref:uncharacterized protein n=1 Tax=Suillus clintonianus TaxID=1904413 RepID=UPI001B882DAE|nr:uncharacterized protein DEU56DRAFT_738781 [Suillus clintonianus]KAG2134113.1 hypothetical protein DEU56DRAFT_738781 [Suillus clintonianus]
MHATLDDLPPEILLPIIAYTLSGESVPSNILCVNHQFRNTGVEWLYRNLCFRSSEQLRLFAQTSENAGVVPRSVTVDLTGKYARPSDVWQYLREAMCRCRDRTETPGVEQKQIPLEILCLRLHSYSQDASHHVFEEALSVVNPRVFQWTGPDPEHHFSTAIIAPVASRLCRIFGIWSNIQDITVTNITFSSELPGVDSDDSVTPLLPEIPGLRTLYVGQAIFLSPGSVAAIFCVNDMASLERVRLVDAYCDSIWGSRIRRSDIEKAAEIIMFPQDVVQSEGVLSRIRKLLTCEMKTERIIGGDRVEGSIFLV